MPTLERTVIDRPADIAVDSGLYVNAAHRYNLLSRFALANGRALRIKGHQDVGEDEVALGPAQRAFLGVQLGDRLTLAPYDWHGTMSARSATFSVSLAGLEGPTEVQAADLAARIHDALDHELLTVGQALGLQYELDGRVLEAELRVLRVRSIESNETVGLCAETHVALEPAEACQHLVVLQPHREERRRVDSLDRARALTDALKTTLWNYVGARDGWHEACEGVQAWLDGRAAFKEELECAWAAQPDAARDAALADLARFDKRLHAAINPPFDGADEATRLRALLDNLLGRGAHAAANTAVFLPARLAEADLWPRLEQRNAARAVLEAAAREVEGIIKELPALHEEFSLYWGQQSSMSMATAARGDLEKLGPRVGAVVNPPVGTGAPELEALVGLLNGLLGLGGRTVFHMFGEMELDREKELARRQPAEE